MFFKSRYKENFDLRQNGLAPLLFDDSKGVERPRVVISRGFSFDASVICRWEEYTRIWIINLLSDHQDKIDRDLTHE